MEPPASYVLMGGFREWMFPPPNVGKCGLARAEIVSQPRRLYGGFALCFTQVTLWALELDWSYLYGSGVVFGRKGEIPRLRQTGYNPLYWNYWMKIPIRRMVQKSGLNLRLELQMKISDCQW